MRHAGASIGIAAMTALLARGTQAHQAVLVSHLTADDPSYQRWLQAAEAELAGHLGPAAAVSRTGSGSVKRAGVSELPVDRRNQCHRSLSPGCLVH